MTNIGLNNGLYPLFYIFSFDKNSVTKFPSKILNLPQHKLYWYLNNVFQWFLPDGRQIAVKRLDKASSQGLEQLKNELLLVAKLRHINLAKLYGVCLKGNN